MLKKLVEKFYCDICGEETDNSGNFTPEGQGDTFDICDKCLRTKTTIQLLTALYSEKHDSLNDQWVNTYIPRLDFQKETNKKRGEVK